jgi:hypothetical protein
MSGTIEILVDGAPVRVRPGISVAAALLGLGRTAWRRSPRQDAARGLFCGMGVCFECLVTIDGVPGQRACLARIHPGMRVETG